MERTINVLSPSQQMAVSRFMSKTYGWMTVGLGFTSLISYLIVTSESALAYMMANPWIINTSIFVEFAVVLALTFLSRRISAPMALMGFLFYSALNGVVFSIIFLAYTATSITQVFLITTGMFAGLAVYGTVTKKDLTGVGSFVGMGLWGLIIVGLMNMFVRSDALSLGLSVAGVVIFTGLTAWDAQRLKMIAYQSVTAGSEAEADKGAIYGALTLYLNFINLFLSLLRLFGTRRE